MKLKLTKGFFAIIDDEDLKKVEHPKWHYQEKRKTGYAIRSIKINGKIKTERLHRIIMRAKKGEIVDHINGNGLDNRKINLRIVSHRENCINRRSFSKSCGYKGVSKIGNKWWARIGQRNNLKILGYFKTPEEAAIAYDNEAIKMYGNFAVLNFK